MRKDKNKTILFGPLPPPYGGVAVFMSKLSAHAMKLGFEVWAYAGNERAVSLPGVRFVNHRRLGHLLQLMLRGRNARIVDSTHFHLEHPHWLLVPLWLVAKAIFRFTWVKVVHDGTLPERSRTFGGIRTLLFRRVIGSVDEFIPVSEDLAAWLRHDLAVRQEVKVISALLPPIEDSVEPSMRREIQQVISAFRTHRQRVCSIGFFSRIYGFHDIVAAIERLRSESGRDIALLLIDGGYTNEPTFREELLRGREWIYFISRLPHELMPKVFDASDAFVRGFGEEGYGLARIEALWSGIPVIAARATEERGMLAYDFGDVETLSEHIANVLNGAKVPDADVWAARFMEDAEQNLRSHIRVIAGEPFEPAAEPTSSRS